MHLETLLALLFSATLSGGSPSEGAAALTLTTGGSTQAPPVAAGSFSASLFKFTVDRPDDGKDEGGGWQKATADLRFVDDRSLFSTDVWTCSVTIGMAIRSQKDGVIPPDKAARTSAKVATDASSNVMPTQEKWLPTYFCRKFSDEMGNIFRHEYGSFGAMVQRCVQKIP